MRFVAVAPLAACLVAVISCRSPYLWTGTGLEPNPGISAALLDRGAISPVPIARTDQIVAAEYVHRIEAGGEGAAAALRSALSLSGIPLQLDSGFIVEGASPRAELPWQPWMVDAVVSGMRMHSTTKLSEVGDNIEKVVSSGTRSGAFGQMLLDGLREAARSDLATDRFWAQFVDALGGRGSLLEGPLEANRTINNVQLGLILSRLSARLAASAAKPSIHGMMRLPPERGPGATGLVAQLVQLPTGTVLPGCYYGTGQLKDLADFFAAIQTTKFGKLLAYLEEHGMPLAGGVSQVLDAVNAVAIIGKLAIVYGSLFDAQIAMDGSRPLVRTHDARSGEKRRLELTLVSRTGSAQFASCLRLALNTIGMDIDIPQNGPVEGAVVQWSLIEDGVDGASPELLDSALVWWYKTAAAERLAADHPGNTFYLDYVDNSVTDQRGHADIGVEGRPQKKAIPLNAPAVGKHFSVRASIAVQQNTMVKPLANGIGVLAGGPLGIAAAIPDMFYGSRWKHSPVFEFPLTDWGMSGYRFDRIALYESGWVRADPTIRKWFNYNVIEDGFVCPKSDGTWFEFGKSTTQWDTGFGAGRSPTQNITFAVNSEEETARLQREFDGGGNNGVFGGVFFLTLLNDPPRLKMVASVATNGEWHRRDNGPVIVPLTPTDDCPAAERSSEMNSPVQRLPVLPPVVQPPGIYHSR